VYEENGIYKAGDPPPQFRLKEAADGSLLGLYMPAPAGDAPKQAGICVPEYFEAALPLTAVARHVGADGQVSLKPYVQVKQAYWSSQAQHSVVAGELWNPTLLPPPAALEDGFRLESYPYLTSTDEPVDLVTHYFLNAPAQKIEGYLFDKKSNTIYDIKRQAFSGSPPTQGPTQLRNFTVLWKPEFFLDGLSYAPPQAASVAAPVSQQSVPASAVPTIMVVADAFNVDKSLSFAGLHQQATDSASHTTWPIALFTGGVLALAMLGYAAKSAWNMSARVRQRPQTPVLTQASQSSNVGAAADGGRE
jgi:hypothetical protein